MSASWKSVSAAEAAEHPLYGVKNWLIVFAFGVLLGLLREIASLNVEALRAGMSLTELLSVDHPAITFLKIALVLDTAIVAAIYWLLFTKHPKFRSVTTWLLLGGFPVLVLLGIRYTFAGLADAMAISFISWAISCAVWVTYLNRSRRVRVTFEHLVRVDELDSPIVVQPSAHSTSVSTFALASQQARPVAAIGSTPASPTGLSVVPSLSTTDATFSEEELWARALTEFESQSRRPGLWARSYSEAGGNEAVAKASYLRLRVIELSAERQAAHAEEECVACQQEERRKLDKLSEAERAHALLSEVHCPNCDAVLPLKTEKCPHCKAMFGPNSAWR